MRWGKAVARLIVLLALFVLILPAADSAQPDPGPGAHDVSRPKQRVHPLTKAHSAPDSLAVQVLRRALLSVSHLAYSGEQTVLTFDSNDGEVCITQETHLGGMRYQVAFRYPPSLRGSLQIADGKTRKLYLPAQKSVVESQLSLPPLTSSSVNARLVQIRKYYRLRLNPRLDTTTGHPAYRLDLLARYHDRPWQRLWIAQDTGLILRRECYDTAGQEQSVSYWRNVQLLKHPHMTWANWQPPAGTHAHQQLPEQETFRLIEARRMAGTWAILPRDLGRGFQFESARLVHVTGTPGLYCQYSDGLNSISLLQTAAPRLLATNSHAQHASLPPIRKTYIGTEPAQVTSYGLFTVLTWGPNKHAVTRSLVGEVAEPVMFAIARSLH
jgi:hypothetical protein